MTRFNQLVVQWPRLIVLLALLITAFLGYHARHVRFNSSADNLYDRNDPEKKYYEAVRARFGSDDMGVIGLVADNVYNPSTLAKIRRITAEIEQLDGVERVQSLTNAPDPIADLGNPPLLVPQIPAS